MPNFPSSLWGFPIVSAYDTLFGDLRRQNPPRAKCNNAPQFDELHRAADLFRVSNFVEVELPVDQLPVYDVELKTTEQFNELRSTVYLTPNAPKISMTVLGTLHDPPAALIERNNRLIFEAVADRGLQTVNAVADLERAKDALYSQVIKLKAEERTARTDLGTVRVEIAAARAELKRVHLQLDCEEDALRTLRSQVEEMRGDLAQLAATRDQAREGLDAVAAILQDGNATPTELGISCSNVTASSGGHVTHWNELTVEPNAADVPYRRLIHGHEVNELNRSLEIRVLDVTGEASSRHYGFFARNSDALELVGALDFQNGPIKTAGVNGISNEAVLAVLIDRLADPQSGHYYSAESLKALGYLEQAAEQLARRAQCKKPALMPHEPRMAEIHHSAIETVDYGFFSGLAGIYGQSLQIGPHLFISGPAGPARPDTSSG